MHVFRSAFHEKDSERESARQSEDGTQVSGRSKARREGVGEETLKVHLQADLTALLHTTRLDAVVDLEDLPHMRSSVVNYGFRDLSRVGLKEIGSQDVVRSIRQSLIDHEPRLVPESIEVTLDGASGDARQFLSFSIKADLMGDPVDIPMDFTADVDLGAGKLRLSKLRMQT